MIGYVTNLQDYQHIADVSISCSKREGLPLNIVEAMLSGTPVVATLNRGHKELIVDGSNGFIVDIDNKEALKDKIIELLDNQNTYDSISKQALDNAKKYTFENVKQELEKIYF